MEKISASRPSPALVIAVLALIAALAGTAAAEPHTTTSAIGKKKVKKIAKKQAVKQINALAPGLSVAHAGTANSASSANTATRAGSANPIAFAQVKSFGSVDPTLSKNVSSSNVTVEGDVFCFRSLSFAFKGAQVTSDYGGGGFNDRSAQFALGDPFDDCSGSNVQAVAVTEMSGQFMPLDFLITFYN